MYFLINRWAGALNPPGGGFEPPLVLSKTARKGELRSMSSKQDETKEKSESTEEEVAEEKQEPADQAQAEEKSESGDSEQNKEKEADQDKADVKEKPLEKMTVKELREIAKDIPGITGVHGMKKDELLTAIKEAKGIKAEPVKKADASTSDLKAQIKSLKAQRQAALEAKDKKMATIYKRRISRLKKKTRRKAA